MSSFSVFASAKSVEKPDSYPFVFVHGMMGWGKTAVIEYIDNKMVIYRSDRERLYLLNFYHTPNIPIVRGSGYTREEWLKEEFSETGLVMSEDRALKILERCHLCYKHKKGYMVQSLWSAIYNCSKQTLNMCVGMDYSKKYTFGVECREFEN